MEDVNTTSGDCSASLDMGKKSQRQRSGRKKKTQAQDPHNFFSEAGIGCHIVHFDAPWLLGSEPFDSDDYEDDVAFPDIAVSPEEPHTLSIINASDHTRTFYVTLFHDVFDGQGKKFTKGTTTDEEGVTRECITFVVVARACTMLHLGMLGDDVDLQEVHAELSSDVQALKLHPDSQAFDPRNTYSFPLEGGPFLCTQGIEGSFTHFFAESCHAIDFRCPVGTPILAIGPGKVAEVRQNHTVTGIH
ncbi:hypothetical protein CYMTET_52462, partial [Cymbomonas tetramitiformis]